MQRTGYNIKRILFATILLLLVVIFMQQRFRIINEWPLKGAVNYTNKPSFNFKNWFDGSFQPRWEKHINEQFGFRNYFVRLNNQIAFNLFNKAKANGVIVGKKNYLYETNYIKAYYGLDSINDSLIDRRLEKVKFLQDTLKKLNIDLILCYAPGKASYYPEYIPDYFKPSRNIRTNYAHYIKKSAALGLNYIDFQEYFLKQKSKSKYPLYPQYGIHWSSYGCNLATDSLVKYIEKLRNTPLNHITWNDIVVTDTLQHSDYDIGNGMNLLFNLKTFPMAYPKLIFENNSAKTKPRLLAVADSYYWVMYDLGISESIFTDGRFWFYNNSVIGERDNFNFVSQLDLKKEIESKDVIVIMAADANLPGFGWGFIENAYSLYIDSSYSLKFKEMMNYIKSQDEWFYVTKTEALQKGISVDSMLYLNAIYIVNELEKKKNGF